ncbi:glycerophosphoryl diester phosphodiesterase membrane domain-containing protein [Paenibacillus abyssi]|uniref:glycerophosphoryl diester phosphodiesterase membrane domain-containing protein n=1 Tax=Paenibacillus abyssi TaxID=1340531 RepID=UPI003619239B
MNTVIARIKNSMDDLMDDLSLTYRKLLLFEAFYMLITSFLFVPIIAFIFNRMLRAMGTNFLLNSDVYQIGLSYKGLIGLTLIGLVCVIVLFIEFGVILIIAQKQVFGKEVLIADALMTTLRAIPKLISFGFIQLILLFLFLIPFIDTPLFGSLFGSFNIPILITNHLHGSQLLLALYAVVFLTAVYLFIRWIFALHFIIIERKSTREAIKSSFALTKSYKIKILLQLILLNIIIFSVGFAVLSALSFIFSLLDIPFVKFVINDLFLTFSSVITFVFTLLLIPVNMIFITRLFYQFQKDQGVQIQDQLRVYKSRLFAALELKASTYFKTRTKRFYLILTLILYLAGTFVLNHSINSNLVYLKWNVSVAGHRGDLYHAPENSMSSIWSAINKNVDAVEIDVQMTKDGIVVLNHDYTLNRVAGVNSSVHDLTYAEIADLEIGSHFSDDFQGEPIPTLIEVLEEVKGKTKLIVEIKPYGEKDELARKVAALIESYDMTADCYVQSFDYHVLNIIRSMNNDIKIGQILYLAAGNLSALDVDFYTIEQSMLSDRFIERAHRNNREVWVWTVNIERNIREVLKYDIDGIITDHPEKAQTMVALR